MITVIVIIIIEIALLIGGTLVMIPVSMLIIVEGFHGLRRRVCACSR